MFICITILLMWILPANYFSWVAISPDVCLIQAIALFCMFRAATARNAYQLVWFTTSVVLAAALLLFHAQLDAYACFLLLAELVTLLFALTILIHLNYTNLEQRVASTRPQLLAGIVALTPTTIAVSRYDYWVDWFAAQSSHYNDLLAQFIYFFLADGPVVVLVGVWLLVVTLLLVGVILALQLGRVSSQTTVAYTRKSQNIWTQWYTKPVSRFFTK